MPGTRATFRPSARLHDDRDYSRVFNRQQKAASRNLVVLVRQRGQASQPDHPVPGRLGVMISVKAVKNAVRRHQLKRWVRELFRLRLATTLAGHDAVVMFRADPGDDHRALDDEIGALVVRALAAQPQPRQGQRPRKASGTTGGTDGRKPGTASGRGERT